MNQVIQKINFLDWFLFETLWLLKKIMIIVYFKQFQTSCKTDVYWIKVDISLDIIQNSYIALRIIFANRFS